MPAPDLTAPSLPVVAWTDPVIDALGYDPRSTYVERFWLTVLGPSTTWLVRHLARRFEDQPHGFTLELDDLAGALGLGHSRGRHSPLVRALHRTCQFGAARVTPDGTLAARRNLPPLTRHQIERLPDAVRAEHHEWRAIERDAATLDAQHRRARRVALALAELGEDVATTEQRLQRWRIHPVVARDAAVWAHRLMAARASDRTLDPAPTAPPAPGGGPASAPAAAPPLPPTADEPGADPLDDLLRPERLPEGEQPPPSPSVGRDDTGERAGGGARPAGATRRLADLGGDAA